MYKEEARFKDKEKKIKKNWGWGPWGWSSSRSGVNLQVTQGVQGTQGVTQGVQD